LSRGNNEGQDLIRGFQDRPFNAGVLGGRLRGREAAGKARSRTAVLGAESGSYCPDTFPDTCAFRCSVVSAPNRRFPTLHSLVKRNTEEPARDSNPDPFITSEVLYQLSYVAEDVPR
jgi:hypothetical protein